MQMATKELKYKFIISEQGDIKIIDRPQFVKDMQRMFAGSVAIGVFRAPKKIRSNAQNGFYFGCFIYEQIECFKERWGEILDREQVHDWNKANVWCEEKVIGDEIIKIPGSSTSKTTAEWEERLEKCRQYFLLNFDWTLPLPNEQKAINYL